jgi:hypothetical protein
MNADFFHAAADGGHRLPIVGLKPLLNATQLKSSNLSRVVRKLFQRGARSSEPNQRLIHAAQYAGISISCQIILPNRSRGVEKHIGLTIPPNVLARADRVIR